MAQIDLGNVMGPAGKTAYQHAREGGYSGTEEQFNAKMAAEHIPASQKGQPDGVATLGSDGKVPAAQLPPLNYIPTSQKGAANGVASLGADGVLLPAQRPSLVQISTAAEMHRMIFRGKNLGGALTAAQKTAIQNGTFEDLYLGDYWVINGYVWRIVDFDYWLYCGYPTEFTKHHLVIMPDSQLGANKQMNTTNTTEGGYIGSLMYTTNMADAKAACVAAFGDNILTYRELFVNAVANGKPTGGDWYDAKIELPSEVMIYGHSQFKPHSDGTTILYDYTVSKTQLALFAVAPKFIVARTTAGARQNYWLRDVVSAARFARVTYYGDADYHDASRTHVGVRSVFPVGVA